MQRWSFGDIMVIDFIALDYDVCYDWFVNDYIMKILYRFPILIK
jgi:hypothetical protein